MKKSLALAFSLGMLLSVSSSMHAKGYDWKHGLFYAGATIGATWAIKRFTPTLLGWIRLKKMLGDEDTERLTTGLSIATSGILLAYMLKKSKE